MVKGRVGIKRYPNGGIIPKVHAVYFSQKCESSNLLRVMQKYLERGNSPTPPFYTKLYNPESAEMLKMKALSN